MVRNVALHCCVFSLSLRLGVVPGIQLVLIFVDGKCMDLVYFK